VAVSNLKPPHGGLKSETAGYVAVSETKRLRIYNGYMKRPLPNKSARSGTVTKSLSVRVPMALSLSWVLVLY
jgi:hypothetical protein